MPSVTVLYASEIKGIAFERLSDENTIIAINGVHNIV